jgi:hypothetical protein
VRDEVTEGVEPEEKSGLSRRNALKAGVAVGVGTVAWSGMTITSLGGTPAYAAGCTFIHQIDLLGGCRNTDSSSPCPVNAPAMFAFRFHDALKQNPAAGFTVENADGPGTIADPGICCDGNTPGSKLPIFKWTDPNLTCQVFTQFWTKNCNSGVVFQSLGSPSAPTNSGAITIQLQCPTIHNPGGTDENAQWGIVAFCFPTGTDPNSPCLHPPV